MEAAETETTKKGFFSQFPKIFWVVNSLELFERGAYYGTMAVLQFHFLLNLFPGLPNVGKIYGLIYTMFIFLLYFVPLVSAALAEKYGYRFVLIVSFVTLIGGYILLFTVQPGQLAYFILALIVLGIGAGAFKPIISASIAHVTEESQRNLAYSIYYWMINLGASIFPFFLALVFGIEEYFHFYFAFSAFVIVVNLLISITFYKDPVQAQKNLSVAKAIKRIIPALKDKKFAVLLGIYAGFWFMFSVNHTYLGWYMLHFQRMPAWFPPPMLAIFNPLTIILLGPFLAKFVDKQKSMHMIMLGITIFCIGLAITGFSNTSFLFIFGIIIFSIGEFITHPGFIAYVSKIAPKKMVAIYMASIFLSTGIGQMVGSTVQGAWYDYLMIGLHRPKLYFAGLISVGLLTLIGFILYNKWMIRETLKVDKFARVDRGFITKPVSVLLALIMIGVVVTGAAAAGTNSFYETDLGGKDKKFTWDDYSIKKGTLSENGYTNEGSQTEVKFNIKESNLLFVNFSLIWTDEPPETIGHINQPDEFSYEVSHDKLGKNESLMLSSGKIYLSIKLNPNKDPDRTGSDEYTVIVFCHDAGDHELRRPSLGLRDVSDDGNNWLLTVEYSYYEKK